MQDAPITAVQQGMQMPDGSFRSGFDADPLAQRQRRARTRAQIRARVARSIRAVEKLRMAGGVAVPRDTPWFVMPDDAPPEVFADPPPYQDAVARLQAALTRAGRAQQLPPHAVERVLCELQAHVGRQDRTAHGVHEAVATWGRSRSGPLPGTFVRRVVVADHVLRLLTGTGLHLPMRAALATLPRRQARVWERDSLARRADLEDALAAGGGKLDVDEVAEAADMPDEQPDDDVPYGSAPPAKVRSARTTDLARIAGDLLDAVLAGTMDPEEAHAAYGVPTAKKPRRWPVFADFIRWRLVYAEDPAAEAELLILFEKARDARYHNPQAKAAATNTIARLLDETGAQRAGELRDILAQLPEPAAPSATKPRPSTAARPRC